MRRIPIESEAIASVGYAPELLEVEFTSHDVYQYLGVPRRVFRSLLRADSVGRYFTSHIRDRYPFRHIR